MPAYAVQIAEYADFTPMLPFGTPAPLIISVIPAHNPCLIGLRSPVQAGSPGQRAEALITVSGFAAVPQDGYTIIINGYVLTGRIQSAVTGKDWALPPSPATTAEWQESMESLFYLIQTHPALGALYDIEFRVLAGPLYRIALVAKNPGESWNFVINQTAALFTNVITNVTSVYVADQYNNWRAYLRISSRTDDFARRNVGQVPFSTLTQARELCYIEKGLTPDNVIPFDIAPFVRPFVSSTPPVHAREAPAVLRWIFCPESLLNVMGDFGDWHDDGFVRGGRQDRLAQAASDNYANRAWWFLNAALPANMTQEELARQCEERVLFEIWGKYLTNCPNGSQETDNFNIAKRVHVRQHEFLYFLYPLLSGPQRAGLPFFVHYVQFEDGTTATYEIPYTFEYDGTSTATIPMPWTGGVFRAEVGVRAIEAFTGLSLEDIETAADSRIRYIRINAGLKFGSDPITRIGECRYYELDNVNRCAPELNEVYFLNQWGGYDTLGAIGRRTANLQTTPAGYQAARDITNRTRAEKTTDRTSGAFDFDAAFRLDLNAGWTYPWFFDWLREMLTSTDVYVYAPAYHDELVVAVTAALGVRAPFNPASIEQSQWSSRDDDELQSLAFSVTLQPDPNFIR